MHHLKPREEIVLAPEYEGSSEGFEHAALIDRSTGSVHTGLAEASLERGGDLALGEGDFSSVAQVIRDGRDS